MANNAASTALRGVRVIDLTSGPAGGLATMMLTDFGAQVVRITRPGTKSPDKTRDIKNDHEQQRDPLETLPAAPMWHRGKQPLELDLNNSDALQELKRLCSAADVVVCSWRPQALVAKGLSPAQMAKSHPHLIFCHITGYGQTGPLSNVPGYEHSAAALSGRMQLFQGLTDRKGPVFSALQVGTHACAQSAASGILAALHARHKEAICNGGAGRGAAVHTSVLQGMLAYEQGAMLAEQFAKTQPEQFPEAPSVPAEPPPASLYYHPAQAGDGRWMQFGNLMPHLFDNFLVATDLIDVIADPDFDAKQMLLPAPKHEAFRERMLRQLTTRTAKQWMETMVENGQVVAGVYQTTQQALHDADLIANGHVRETANGVQLGPVARLSATPAIIGSGGDDRKGFNIDNWLDSPRQSTAASSHTESKTESARQTLPLDGVRVLEIATIIAAPFGASLLADMGADVIKVEQIGGDPYRGLLAGVGSARVNAGKRSLSVNLKSPQGKEMVLRFARESDILIHNYRPGVPERLGIDYAAIRAINPKIVYLQCNGYGPDGPGADRPSTHPIPGAALGGVLHQLGERVPSELQDIERLKLWTRRLMRANEVNPDPNTAVVVATSALLGLNALDRTGEGQKVLVDMFGANAYANHDDFLSYPGKRNRAQPNEDLRGLNPTYRLYQCADERWVFLAMTNPREHRRFLAAVKSMSPKIEHSITQEQLGDNQKQLGTVLDALFEQAPAHAWEAACVAQQVACLSADRFTPHEFWLNHEQAKASKFTSTAVHPQWGSYQRHGPMVTFDELEGGACEARPSSPLAGQHNRELLLEHGYSEEDINEFEKENIIWSEPV